MLKKCVVVFLFISILSVPLQAQDAKAVIAAASKAMGADNVKSVQYSGPGSEFSFGQAYNPSSGWPEFKHKTYTRTIDFETPALRIDRVPEPVDPTRKGGGLAPAASQTIIVNANTGWAQQLEIWKTPYGFLRAATANNATVKSQTVGGKKFNVVTFMGQNKAKVNGYINDQNMLERVETWIDNAITGDTVLDIGYNSYKDFAGAKFPTKIVEKQGGYPTLDLTVADVKPNIAANIQAPQGRGGAPGGGGGGAAPAQPSATSQKLADGVYLILPGYAALAVDFKDYI